MAEPHALTIDRLRRYVGATADARWRGRHAILARMRRGIEGGGATGRCVQLEGPPGAGKSELLRRLALECSSVSVYLDALQVGAGAGEGRPPWDTALTTALAQALARAGRIDGETAEWAGARRDELLTACEGSPLARVARRLGDSRFDELGPAAWGALIGGLSEWAGGRLALLVDGAADAGAARCGWLGELCAVAMAEGAAVVAEAPATGRDPSAGSRRLRGSYAIDAARTARGDRAGAGDRAYRRGL